MRHWLFRRRWLALLVGMALLVLAHYSALLFRVQPVVSFWFPPSGVAVALSLWFGPVAAIATGLVAVAVAPLWGSHGWAQWVGCLDALEPLIAWWLYRVVLHRSLTLHRVTDVIAFILSAPILACLGSAIAGSIAAVLIGNLAAADMTTVILQWWLGNAIGVMTITPVALLMLTPRLQQWGWLPANTTIVPVPTLQSHNRCRLRAEKAAIFGMSAAIALLSVSHTTQTGFAFQQFAFLNYIPILWAALRLGAIGSTLTASFCVVTTLISYVWQYPTALELAQFPLASSILTVHKLSLVTQSAIALLMGTAITQQIQTQIKLAVSQLQLEEYKVRSQLNQELAQTNQALATINAQLEQVNQDKDQLLQREQAARSQAETANRLKDEFLAIVSHELRSPLNPILGWTRLLQNSQLEPAKTAKALETILRNAELQSQLIEDLLDVSRILRGKLDLNEQVLDLVPVVRSTVEAARLSAEAKAIALSFKGPETASELLVRGDLNRLQQVVMNLLTNAIKFTPAGGQVQVLLRQSEPAIDPTTEPNLGATLSIPQVDTQVDTQADTQAYAQITVQDTGKGIDPVFLPHVFERFRQQDGSTTRSYGGLGLGLAIVRHLVELQGGTVTADSAGENLGATFTVKLPIAPSSSQSSSAQPPSAVPRPAALQARKILVVDDDADTRELLQYILEAEQAIVKAVASAQAAIQQIETFQPSLIISDISMPDMDGYALIGALRRHRNLQAHPVIAIALTANAKEEDRLKAIAAGFDAHLAKPIAPEVLLTEISQFFPSKPPRYCDHSR